MLNLPAIFTGTTGMDPYGFFTLDPVAERPWPWYCRCCSAPPPPRPGTRSTACCARDRPGTPATAMALSTAAPCCSVLPSASPLPNSFPHRLQRQANGTGIGRHIVHLFVHHRGPPRPRNPTRPCHGTHLVHLLRRLHSRVPGPLHPVHAGDVLGRAGPLHRQLLLELGVLLERPGIPAEEFSLRHRNGLLAFTLAGCCYMTVAIGGSLLGAILAWARTGPKQAGNSPPARRLPTPRAAGRGSRPAER